MRRDFYDYLRIEDVGTLLELKKISEMDLAAAVEFLKSLEPKFKDFVRRHNFGQTRYTDRPRIEIYNEKAAERAKDLSVEEINKNILFLQQAVLANNGATVDGRHYNVDRYNEYRNRSDTYIGVAPEGNSTFAVLFTYNDKTKALKRITELEWCDQAPTLAQDRTKSLIEDFAMQAKLNDEQEARFVAAKARSEAGNKVRAEAANPPPAPEAPPAPIPKPPKPAPAPILPVRPNIQIRKAA